MRPIASPAVLPHFTCHALLDPRGTARASDLAVSNDVGHLQRFLMICVCCSLGSAACGSGSGDYGDAPLSSGGQFRWEFAAGPPRPETLLVLVDDAMAGASLREALAKAFDDWDTELARH